MHCLRHNYCTMLFEQKADLQTVKVLMGHDDIQTTLSVYIHYTEKNIKTKQKESSEYQLMFIYGIFISHLLDTNQKITLM